MRFGIYKQNWYCRWCGKQYKPLKETDRDGFCSPACKQAHHRAYKLYIDWKSGARRKRTKVALSRKMDPQIEKTGTRKRRNAKRCKDKRRIKRPVRVKFYTKGDKKLKLSSVGITR